MTTREREIGPNATDHLPVVVHQPSSEVTPTPWMTVFEAAQRARCGPKVIYREVQSGRLRAARVGGRRELRLRAEWVDEWLTATTPSTPETDLR